jgi:tRNA threonylcarbamoyladenosine biosynthesis protein TsaB
MKILTIRTDAPSAEIGIYVDRKRDNYIVWEAHYELAETIHQKISDLCKKSGIELIDLRGIVCFEGPGSYTGLRIGLSVGNALSYGLKIPIVTAKGNDWIVSGVNKLSSGKNEMPVLPSYGGKINATLPKR